MIKIFRDWLLDNIFEDLFYIVSFGQPTFFSGVSLFAKMGGIRYLILCLVLLNLRGFTAFYFTSEDIGEKGEYVAYYFCHNYHPHPKDGAR